MILHPAVEPVAIEVATATLEDVQGIHDLLEHYARAGELLPRPLNNICRQIQQFYVIRNAGCVVACASLEVFTRSLGEVRSLAVDARYQAHGLGRQLVAHIIKTAQNLGMKRLMALTYVPEFFGRLEFEIVSKDIFPEKVWGHCIHCPKHKACDEIAVLRYL